MEHSPGNGYDQNLLVLDSCAVKCQCQKERTRVLMAGFSHFIPREA